MPGKGRRVVHTFTVQPEYVGTIKDMQRRFRLDRSELVRGSLMLVQRLQEESGLTDDELRSALLRLTRGAPAPQEQAAPLGKVLPFRQAGG